MTSEGRTIDVFVEIPKGSRNKYEYDHGSGRIRLDRRLFSATVYPGDYGFIPDTLAEDGDPLDALVLVEDATFPGCTVTARPLGVFMMEDEKGRDAKIICVPAGEPVWVGTVSIDQVPDVIRAEIQHFFDVYKALEPTKRATTLGFEGYDKALEEIDAAVERRRNTTAT